MVPNLVKILKNLVLSGFAPEYDVGGITDPVRVSRVAFSPSSFLLSFLRLLPFLLLID